jgi:hypothetical protein
MRRLNETHGREDLLLKIGIHARIERDGAGGA